MECGGDLRWTPSRTAIVLGCSVDTSEGLNSTEEPGPDLPIKDGTEGGGGGSHRAQAGGFLTGSACAKALSLVDQLGKSWRSQRV